MPSTRIKVPGGGTVSIPHFPIDMVGAHERAQSFTKRSIKNESKLDALYLATSMLDLTTLEGNDTREKVRYLAAKARHPLKRVYMDGLVEGRDFKPIPSCAAVCVYPSLVPVAKEVLEGSSVNIAAVATAFPSGQLPTDLKLAEVKRAIKLGANEIDMVIDRDAFLSGKYQKVFDEIVAVRDICGDEAHLKVILETGELQTLDKVRFASWLAMEAGAHFIKTSTGKFKESATLPVTLVMLQAISDFHHETGKIIGMKPAGGIRTAKQALQYLVMVREILGPNWLTPELFRFGASVLLNDILRQIFKQLTGRYYNVESFSQE